MTDLSYNPAWGWLTTWARIPSQGALLALFFVWLALVCHFLVPVILRHRRRRRFGPGDWRLSPGASARWGYDVGWPLFMMGSGPVFGVATVSHGGGEVENSASTGA